MQPRGLREKLRPERKTQKGRRDVPRDERTEPEQFRDALRGPAVRSPDRQRRPQPSRIYRRHERGQRSEKSGAE